MHFHARPISFKPPRLNGLSARLLASHYENNYGGAVRRLNAILDDLMASDPAALSGFRLNGLKREELVATNSMLLHEVYFDSLGEGGGGDPDGALAEAIARDFGSLGRWRGEFVAMGKALGGGSGWVVLTRSPRDGRLSNVWSADHTHSLAGGTPLLALDMYEHSYHLDFGSNAAGYVDAFMANIAWSRVAARWAGAAVQAKPNTVDAPTARAMLDADPDLLVIDARLAVDARSVPVGLRGARRVPPERVDDIAASLPPGARALVYCAWGFEIGGDCAAKLRERGIDAVVIAGGIGTWRANGLPTEPLNEKEGEAS
ncbi:Fe-Mn family superoxide dismutase [Reyranella sp.]|uniref:Fe-Mn family superoxide dismutase n=1 Tax=Reyranella sp. TaxID=1929291 RepID=UPI003D0E8ABB